MNKPNAPSRENTIAAPRPLLSYEDIYHAAGIMSPRSGYGIQKVVDMLNSERIRDLAGEVKRASVLMALEAAGASVEELLQDANRRQQALNAYEAAQRRQVETFEARRAQENSELQSEMQRITAHYAERIEQNEEQVAQEKESLRNWQMAKQHEDQRIAEVLALCSKQPSQVMASAAGASETGRAALRPTLVADAQTRG